ncbi:MAG: NYN domain-containing protein [Candidatus Omnitrophica bacterium]|nr:NYN domain-containing protein [Candidatus Omnitrophota bacterium]
MEINNYAFIDGNNLNWGIKSMGWKLDYKKFRIYLRDKYKVTKAFIFIGYKPGNERLYESLQEDNYICIFKPIMEIKTGKKIKIKGNVDALMVLHIMIELPNYDKAVIVSGDGDFYSIIEYLIQKNKLLKIVVPNEKYSTLLKKFSMFILPINLIKGKVELK